MPRCPIVVDTQEKKPFDFGHWPVVSKALDSGDYAIQLGKGVQVAVERKSVADLAHCLTADWKRFQRQLDKSTRNKAFIVIVEGQLWEVVSKATARSVTPATVLHKRVCHVMALGIPIMFCAGKEEAARLTFQYLHSFMP